MSWMPVNAFSQHWKAKNIGCKEILKNCSDGLDQPSILNEKLYQG